MTGAVKSRIFPKVSAPSIDNDDFGLATKRTDNRKNLFHKMDDLESLTQTP